MFPFSSILEGVDRGLAVPSSININSMGGWNDAAYAGFKFDEDRTFYTRLKAVYTPITNAWVHEDSKPIIDPNDFECMVDNVDLGSIGDGSWNPAGGSGSWLSCDVDRNWWLFIYGTQFEGLKIGIVTGDYHIREKLIPSNIASGSFTLTASYEGQN